MSNSATPPEPVPPMPSPWPAPDIPEFGPRKVRFTGGIGSWLLTLRALSLSVVVIGTPIVLSRAETLNRFVNEGKVLRGRITDRVYEGENRYRLHFEYGVGGVWVERNDVVSQEFYSRTQIGGPIVLTALPSDPESFLIGTVTPNDVRKGQILESAIVIVVSCLIALIRVQARKKANEELAMLRDWRALPAQVTRNTRDLALDDAESGGAYSRTVRYRVRMPDGSVQEKMLFTSAALPTFEVGTFFTVLHEPRTKHSVVPVHTLTSVELGT